MNYLSELYISVKEIIEQTRNDIKPKEDDFDHITECLGQFKVNSTLKLSSLANTHFNDPNMKLEDSVFEWAKTFKSDAEVYTILQSNV